MCQVDPFGLTCPRNRRCTSGAYVCVQRHTVVWSTDKPRSAISSSTSRRLSENRRYHRTQVTIISAANWRLRNKGTRRNPIRSPYQIPSLEVATLPCREIVKLIDEHYDDPAYFRYFSLWGSCRRLVAYLDPSIEIKTKVDYPSSGAEETRCPFLVSTESKKA